MSSASPSIERINSYRKFEPLLVRAGAGAGKTTELVERIVALGLEAIQQRQSLPRIVATTFTRKATQEMRERILKLVLNLRSEPSLVLSELEFGELLSWAQNPDQLWVTTLDGLALKVVQQLGSFEILISQEIEFLSENGFSNKKLFRKVLRELISEDAAFSSACSVLLEYGDLDDLAEWIQKLEAKSLVEAELSPVSKEEINQHLNEAADRLRELASQIEKEWVPKTHAQKKLHSWICEMRHLKSTDALIDWVSQNQSLKSLPHLEASPSKEFKEWVRFLADAAWEAPFVEAHSLFLNAIDKVHKKLLPRLLQEKFRLGQWTVRDFEEQLLRLLKRSPEGVQAFSKEWDYWFIDEYQDISAHQERWLNELAPEDRVYRVGDPQQSIYLFRGARSDLFLKRENSLIRQASSLYRQKLVNFRSRPELIEFANRCFQEFSGFAAMSSGRANTEQAATEQARIKQGDQRVDAEPSLTSLQGAEGLTLRGIEIERSPKKSEDTEEKFTEAVRAEKVKTAYYQVALEVAKLVRGGVKPSKIAVLAQTRKSFLQLAQHFKLLGVPAFFHGDGHLKGASLSLDALRFLKFLALPKDRFNLFAFLSSKALGLDKEMLAKWALNWKTSPDRFPWEVEDWSALGDLSQKLQGWANQVSGESLVSVWSEGLGEMGFFELSRSLDPTGFAEAELLCLVAKIQKDSKGWGRTDSPLFLDLNEWLGEILSPGPVPAGRTDAVQVMTVHAAKGLEFDFVVIAISGETRVRSDIEKIFYHSSVPGKSCYGFELRLDPESFKHSSEEVRKKVQDKKYARKTKPLRFPFFRRAVEKKDLLADCVRSFYVAMTRARDSLCLVWTEELFGEAQRNLSQKEDESQETQISTGWEDLLPRLKEVLSDRVERVIVDKAELDNFLSGNPFSNPDLSVQMLTLESSKSKKHGASTQDENSYLGVFSVSRLVSAIHRLERAGKGTPFSESGSGKTKKWNSALQGSVNSSLGPIAFQNYLSREKGTLCHGQLQLASMALATAGDEAKLFWKEKLISLVGSQADLLESLMIRGFPEWGFTLPVKAKFLLDLQGKIDLWSIDASGALWVVDYKTGAELDVDKAFRQVRIYAWALWQLKDFWQSKVFRDREEVKVKKIKLAVIDLNKQKIEVQEVHPDEQGHQGTEWDWGLSSDLLVRAAVLEVGHGAGDDSWVKEDLITQDLN